MVAWKPSNTFWPTLGLIVVLVIILVITFYTTVLQAHTPQDQGKSGAVILNRYSSAVAPLTINGKSGPKACMLSINLCRDTGDCYFTACKRLDGTVSICVLRDDITEDEVNTIINALRFLYPERTNMFNLSPYVTN